MGGVGGRPPRSPRPGIGFLCPIAILSDRSKGKSPVQGQALLPGLLLITVKILDGPRRPEDHILQPFGAGVGGESCSKQLF